MGKLIGQFNGGNETPTINDTDKFYKRDDSEPSVNRKDQFITWSSLKDRINESFSSIAISGDYNDLTNTPTIPNPQVNSDWNSYDGVSQILNKPTLGTASEKDVGTEAGNVVVLDEEGNYQVV